MCERNPSAENEDGPEIVAGGVAGHRRWRARGLWWSLLAIGIVVVASGASLLLARRGSGESRWRLYAQGVDAFENGSFGLASEAFTDYLNRFAENASARYMLGVSLYRLGKTREALEEVERASRDDPDLDEASLFLSEQAFRAGRLREALVYAEQALAKPPKPASAHLLAGIVLGQAEFRDVAGGIAHLEAAERAGLGSVFSRLVLVELLKELRSAFPERVDGAEWNNLVTKVESALKEQIGVKGDDAGTWLLLARLYLAADDLAGVQSALSACRRLGRQPSEYWCLRAEAAWKAGDRSTAREAISQALALNFSAEVLVDLAGFLDQVDAPDLEREALARGDEKFAELASYQLWRGDWYLRHDRPQDAIVLAERALGLWKDDTGFFLLRAEGLARTGRREEAVAALRGLIDADRRPEVGRLRLADLLLSDDSVSPSARKEAARLIADAAAGEGRLRAWSEFLLGKIELLEGRLESALEHLSVAASRDPMPTRYHVVLADALVRQNRPEDAAEQLSAAIRLRPGDDRLLLSRAAVRIEAAGDHLRAARADILEVLGRFPNDKGALCLLAEIAGRERSVATPEDLERLTEAAKAPDATPQVLVSIGECELRRGHPSRARELAAHAAERAGSADARWDALELQARAIEAEKKGAAEDFLRAAGGRADTAEDWVRYGWMLLERGDPAAAAEWAARALESAPENVRALRLAFESGFRGQDGDAAFRTASDLVDRIREAAPESTDEFYARGKLALLRGQSAEARDLLKRAVALAPADYYAACFLGRALLELGETGEAEIRLERALELRPDFRTARAYLARLLVDRAAAELSAGKAGAAARDFLRADDLDPRSGRGAVGFARTVLDPSLRDNMLLRRQARDRCRRTIEEFEDGVPAGAEKDVLDQALVMAANLALLDRDWKDTSRRMAEYLERHPEDEGAVLRQAIALLFSGEGGAAVENLERLVGAAPESWPATALLGEAYLRTGRAERAEELLRGWLGRHPTDPAGALSLAEALRRQGRGGDAVGILADLVRVRPDSVAGAKRLVELAGNPESRATAKAALEAAREHSAHSAEILYLLERLEAASTGDDPRPKVLEECVSRGFHDDALEAGCYAALIRRLVNAGRGPDAVVYARRFVSEIAPRLDQAAEPPPELVLAEAWEMAGVALYGERDLEAAEACFRRACRLAPKDGLAANNLAYLILEKPVPEGYPHRGTDLDEALELARCALEAEAQNPEYLDTMGAVLVAREEWAKAVPVLEQAVEKWGEDDADPGRKESASRALVRLAVALARTGDRAGGRAALERAEARWPGIRGTAAYRQAADDLAN